MTTTLHERTNGQAVASGRQGYVDVASPQGISGWAYDKTRPNQPLFVDIEVNQERIARLKACLYRDDLRKQGYSDGRVGFDFNPSKYLQGGENHVRILYAGTDEVVDGGVHVLLNVGGAADRHSEAELLELSQERWQDDEDEERLTWGTMMTGDTFVDVVQQHHAFTGAETVVEIGPGYGRLLSCFLGRKLPFARYVGLEISAARVERLTRRFPHPGVEFLHADILRDRPDIRADVVVCSSTFEHLFPSMAKALQNLKAMSTPRVQLFIDFIVSEGDDELHLSKAYFEDTTAYIRIYSRQEIERLFAQAGFRVKGVQNIVQGKDTHGKDVRRALVIAGRRE